MRESAEPGGPMQEGRNTRSFEYVAREESSRKRQKRSSNDSEAGHIAAFSIFGLSFLYKS